MQKTAALTVSQITQAIKKNLESSFPNLCVQGEVSNFKKQSSGHLYFSIKDADAQLSCVMFRGYAGQLQKLPREGDQVVLTGDLNVYAPRGGYQLMCKTLELAGLGELLVKLEQLKREIHSRGWFRQEHKQPLPAFPKKIGIITSPTGAAVRDMLNVLSRRLSSFDVRIYPVRVQGDEAAQEIATAIEALNTHQLVDVILLGRGGGSIEDLWAFNEERVAEAVFTSKIPIICAVGHETDHTIAEYVADMRAPTPSAAAELVAKESSLYQERLMQARQAINRALTHQLEKGRHQLTGVLRHPIFSDPYALFGFEMQKLDEVRQGLDRMMHTQLRQTKLQIQGLGKQVEGQNPLRQIVHSRQRLASLGVRLNEHMQQLLVLKKQRMQGLKEHLKAIDPKNLLDQGYSLVRDQESGKLITDAAKAPIGSRVELVFASGRREATIEK